MRQRLFGLILVLALLPTVELVEWGAHFVTHGDFAHGSGEAHEEAESDEHGCSSMFHACGCHGAAPSTTAVSRRSMTAPDTNSRTLHLAYAASFSRPLDPPLNPPPIV